MDSHYPEAFARFYDTIYATIRAGVDTDYFLRNIAEARGPVLEVGTGTGRFFAEALSRGADIYGIDISPSMLEILRAKIRPEDQYRVSEQDIRNFSIDREFALIAAPFRVFMHLMDTEAQVKALNHVYDSLREGGRFLFDLFIPDPKLIANGLKKVTDFNGEWAPGETLRRITSANYDLIRQVIDITFRLEWTEGGQPFQETWNTCLRFFFRYELEYLIRQSKFRKFNIFGDYNEGELSKSSREFVVVCSK
jgi:SAM-dependent methyltransferase